MKKQTQLEMAKTWIKPTKMKTKVLFFVFATLTFTACGYGTDEIRGHAYLVDNFTDKNPIEGAYIELIYTTDGGYNYHFLDGVSTDMYGHFKIDTEYKTGFICLDCWVKANVYSDKQYTDTLGSFGFYFANKTYSYSTIHLDTFALEHKVWIVPKIRNLEAYQADEISIDFYNAELLDSAQNIMNYVGPITVNQKFTAVEMKMTMRMQHWLSYGSKDLARGSLMKDSKEIGFGYFKLENAKHTIEGDTLYLMFDVSTIK